MILYTSYHLAETHGASFDKCEAYRKVVDAVGGQGTEGISLKAVLDNTSLKDALWCLRAVHPEQLFSARMAARKWTVEAARDAVQFHTNRFLV
jgi:hypothetical protein